MKKSSKDIVQQLLSSGVITKEKYEEVRKTLDADARTLTPPMPSRPVADPSSTASVPRAFTRRWRETTSPLAVRPSTRSVRRR